MTAYPAWASTEEARAIIAAIVAERPDFRICTNRLPAQFGGYLGSPERRYIGKTVGQLRRLWNEARETLWEQAERNFAEGTPWADAVAPFDACAATPPDMLIEQLLPIEKARHVLTDRVVRRVA